MGCALLSRMRMFLLPELPSKLSIFMECYMNRSFASEIVSERTV